MNIKPLFGPSNPVPGSPVDQRVWLIMFSQVPANRHPSVIAQNIRMRGIMNFTNDPLAYLYGPGRSLR